MTVGGKHSANCQQNPQITLRTPEQTGLAYTPLYTPRTLSGGKPHVLHSPDQSCTQALCKPIFIISKFLGTPMAPNVIFDLLRKKFWKYFN